MTRNINPMSANTRQANSMRSRMADSYALYTLAKLANRTAVLMDNTSSLLDDAIVYPYVDVSELVQFIAYVDDIPTPIVANSTNELCEQLFTLEGEGYTHISGIAAELAMGITPHVWQGERMYYISHVLESL